MKFKTNPDNDFVRELKKEIKNNNGYCPSSFIKNKDTKCPCKLFREETKSGYCECGLYYKD